MMKRMVIVAAAMAIVASSAMAASLIRVDPVGTNTASAVWAITNDGAWATGHGVGNTNDRAFVYRVSDGFTITNIVAGSYLVSGTGIGYRTVSGTKYLVAGGKQSSAQIGMFQTSDNGTTWARPWGSSGSAPSTAGYNSVGGSGANDTAWMVWAEGTSSYSLTRIYDATSGTATKSVAQSGYVQGVSDTGRGACARKDTTGTKRSLYLDFTSDGGTAAENYIANSIGNNYGQATSVAGNGSVVFGQAPIVAGGTTNFPYAKTVGGSFVNLPLLPGSTGSVSLGYPYGASEDGNAACGMDYAGKELAAVWWRSNNGTWMVTDLTDLATSLGILDGFTGNLRRAYTMGTDPVTGHYVVAGMGVYYAPGSTVALTRGFIMTLPFPEPATMAFLALGGLALLRRRR